MQNSTKTDANPAAAVALPERDGSGRPYSLSIRTLKPPKPKTSDTLPLYDYHQSMTKCYPDKMVFYRFKRALQVRKPGFELPVRETNRKPTPEQVADNAERSLRRTRQALRDLTDCNSFDKFATFTFDPARHDPYDYPACQRKMTKWLGKQQERHGKFRYIIVSELMKDGKLHFHALLGDFTGKYHKTRTRGSKNTLRQCYKIDAWERNYGFADMEDISDKNRIANYIGKYITKDFTDKAPQQKRYWASKGLKTPTIRYDDELHQLISANPVDVGNLSHYENDHCEITTFPLKDNSGNA